MPRPRIDRRHTGGLSLSLHPLNPEPLAIEVALAGGAIAGGIALRHHGHPVLGIGAWALSGFVALSILGAIATEAGQMPPREMLRSFRIALTIDGALCLILLPSVYLSRHGHPALSGLTVVVGFVLAIAIAIGVTDFLERRKARSSANPDGDGGTGGRA